MKKSQAGYTLTELIVVIGMLVSFVVVGFVIKVIWHFVAKAW